MQPLSQKDLIPAESGDSALTVMARMDLAMLDRGLSSNSRRQYHAIAQRFEDFACGLEGWETNEPTYESMSRAITAWFAQISLNSPSSVATYRSAVSRYAAASGYEIRVCGLVEVEKKDRGNTARIEPATDEQLRRMRNEARESPITRSALELALSGLPVARIAQVRAVQLTATPGKNIGRITYPATDEYVEIFDPISVRWLTGQGLGHLPWDHKVSELAVQERLARLVWRTTRARGGVRILRLTGIRRSIAMGIRKQRLADSLGQVFREKWDGFHRRPSKLPGGGNEPEPADPARGRALMEFSDQEFDRMLEDLIDAA